MSFYKNRLTALLVLFTLNGVFGQDIIFKGNQQDKSSFNKLEKHLSQYDVYHIDTKDLVNFRHKKKDKYSVNLQLSQELSFDLTLYENDLRSDDYIVRLSTENGEERIPRSHNIAFKGYHNGGDKVVLSMTDNFIMGSIEHKGEKYYIEPLRHLIKESQRNLFVVYKKSDVIPAESNQCLAIKVAEQQLNVNHAYVKQTSRFCYKVRIASANDYSIFAHYGSNYDEQIDLNIAILNGVAAQFDDEFDTDIEMEIVEQFISTCSTCDPWETNTTDGETQLRNFKDWGNAGGFNNPNNLATMWTKRTLAGGFGWAWVGSLNIPNIRYSLRRLAGTTLQGITGLAVHEIGHNFGATHNDSNCNMNNSFASCWTQSNQNKINSIIVKAANNNHIESCIDCDNGYVLFDQLDPECPTNELRCPESPFQVCGTFRNPSCMVAVGATPDFTLNIIGRYGQLGNSIVNPVVDAVAGTYCFTVDPNDEYNSFGGNFEFHVFVDYDAGEQSMTLEKLGAHEGVDIIFGGCPPACPRAGKDVRVSFCNTNSTYNLEDYLKHGDPGGIWGAAFSDGLFNPLLDGNLGQNTIMYTIPATAECDGGSSTMTIAINDCHASGGHYNGNWYFGEKAGLSFNGNSTSVLLDGQTPSDFECTATASDVNGNLLFYTNGNTVWNKNHTIMEGGNNTLLATNYNDQSVTVLPIPNSNKYYIFTEDSGTPYSDGSFNSTFYFSIVDLDANDGLGRIESLNTELFHTSFLDETDFTFYSYAYFHNMTTALHADGESYWLILHPANTFIAFHITEDILSPLPEYKLSTVDDFKEDLSCSTMYEYSLKASPRGDKLAYVGTNFGCLRVSILYTHDFDNATGFLTGYEDAITENLAPHYTSIEFSSDGKILYGDYAGSWNYEVHAYELNGLYGPPVILDSGIEVPDEVYQGNYIQRAVDGNVYSTIGSSSSQISKLSNINDINSVNLSVDAIDLTRAIQQFPPAIPVLPAPCLKKVNVSSNVSLGQVDMQQAREDIVVSSTLEAGSIAIYNAGEDISFEADFHAKAGSQFKAFIYGCN